MSKDTSGQSSTQGKQQSSEMSQGRTSAQQGSQTYQPTTQGSRWSQTPADVSGRRSAARYGPYGGGPFSTMRRISDEMDRLFDSFGFGGGWFPSELGHGGDFQSTAMHWAPHVDVVERDGKLLISADLPGVKKDDVKVDINQDLVTIQGQRHQEKSSNERGYYQSERSYGSFYRTIQLPEGANTESASATFRDGVLQIEIAAPTQQARGRSLEIRDGEPAMGTTSGSGTSGTQQQR